MKCAIVSVIFVLAASAAGFASDPQPDVDQYLAGFEVARLADTATRDALGAHLATDGEESIAKKSEQDWVAVIELYVFVPISASGDVSFPNTSSAGASAQRSPAQSGGSTDLIDVDGLSGFVIPIRTIWLNGRWGFLFEVTYADLDMDGELNGLASNPFDLDFTFWYFDLSFVYRFVDQKPGQQPWLLTGFAGARVSQYELTISVDSGERRRKSDTFIEPLIGAYVGYAFNASWSLLMRLDASGFGASGHDELTYNFELGVVWKFGKRKQWLIDFGWRYAAIQYENGSGIGERKVDITLHGPFIAFGYAF